MKAERTARFCRLLLAKRRALFEEVSNVETNLQQIAEDREPELEEAAQEERTARVLARLDVRGKSELEEIDQALARIDDGNYGVCLRCRAVIALRRLEALPATPYCRTCAQETEHRGAAETEPPEPVRSGLVPPDYSLLSDREIEVAIRDLLREDGRVDMEELRVVYRHGVVHLSGPVPSEAGHQIVLQTVTDLMGLKEVDDRMQVEEILWEREDRDRQEALPEARPWEEQGGTEDVTETHEDGTDFVPPIRPMPEEE